MAEALQLELARRVREGAAFYGMSQRALAEEVGISQKHLSQMLNGRAKGSLSLWSRLLGALDDPLVGDVDRR